MEFVIRGARDNNDFENVYRLTYESYLQEGYCVENQSKQLIHYPHLDRIPETQVLVCEKDGEIIGTNSFTVDGLWGLHAEIDFKEHCNRLRERGLKLSSSWRIIVKNEYRSSRSIVMALIKETIKKFLDSASDTLICTFNPKHREFYERIIKFKFISNGFFQNGTVNAPSVLMSLSKSDIPSKLLPL